jgi:hypothetical protein
MAERLSHSTFLPSGSGYPRGGARVALSALVRAEGLDYAGHVEGEHDAVTDHVLPAQRERRRDAGLVVRVHYSAEVFDVPHVGPYGRAIFGTVRSSRSPEELVCRVLDRAMQRPGVGGGLSDTSPSCSRGPQPDNDPVAARTPDAGRAPDLRPLPNTDEIDSNALTGNWPAGPIATARRTARAPEARSRRGRRRS